MVMIVAAGFLSFTACSKERVGPKKQIILLSVDTLRADHLSAYGYSRDTSPHISEFLKDSVQYTQAYPNGCWTMPSHMSLLTGTLPSRHGITKPWGTAFKKKFWKLNESIKTIPEVLEKHDAAIKTIKFAKLPAELGFAKGYEKNFELDPFLTPKNLADLLKEIEANKDDDFFYFLHTWIVHAPYTHPYFLEEGRLSAEKSSYLQHPKQMGGGDVRLIRKVREFLMENGLFNAQDCMALYDGGIRHMDELFGEVIEKCKKLGIYDDVMIIVVSDHGEHFAEHYPDLFYNEHGHDYYQEFIKVPLIIKFPAGTVKPGVVDDLVSLVDVFPTILDFFKVQGPDYFQGRSLLKPHTTKDNVLISEAVSMPKEERKMLRMGDLKFIVTMENPSEGDRVNWEEVTDRRLFDLKNDPLEKKNLYSDLKFREVCQNFETLLKQKISASAGSQRSFQETTIETETLDQMKALGYIE